jgi:hypothetical protein
MELQTLRSRSFLNGAFGVGLCFCAVTMSLRTSSLPISDGHATSPIPEANALAVRGPVSHAPISAHVSLGCQPSEGFVARVVAQAGERSASRFPLGNGFVAVYRDGSWVHIAEFEQPCVIASGSRADMITYFQVE